MRVTRFRLEGPVSELANQVRALAPAPGEVAEEVATTIEAVRNGGDAALLELSQRYDGVQPQTLSVGAEELNAAAESADPAITAALATAAENIRAVAEAQLVTDSPRIELAQGHAVTVRRLAVASAGVYVPGGGASYPSTVLMGSIPARVAGVQRVAVATPPGADGAADSNVLAACAIAGVDEVYPVGGAQAVAALAYGTESIDAVDVVAGPGSARVQEAKLQVSRQTGIDSFAGPSELMVLFDGAAPIEWLALDLCAQAEHGAAGLLIAVATEASLLDQLSGAVSSTASERPSVSDAPLALVEAADVEAGVGLADAIAPEHLQLACEGAVELADVVRSAGCVLVGATSATAFGDYAAGSNHILPTGGAGSFAGPLSPETFRRSMSSVEIPPAAAAALAEPVEALAEAEGFPVHGESVRARAGSGRATDLAGKMEST